MNIIVFRILIVLVIIIHISYVNIEPLLVYDLDSPTYLLPMNMWYAIYFILFVSLVGLFFLFKFFRIIFLITVIICMGIVLLQGGIALSAFENFLLQLGSGLYGGIIAMSYFSNLNWRNHSAK